MKNLIVGFFLFTAALLFAGQTVTGNIQANTYGSSGLISNTELDLLNGASSNIQAQLNAKEPSFAKNTAFNKNFGTSSGTVAEGNDSRILNGQTAYGWGNHASQNYLDLDSKPFSAVTNGSSNPSTGDQIYDFCETTQNYLKTSENNDNADDVTLSDVQSATSSDFHNIGGTDDDVPDAGDFGAATDLDANGSLAEACVGAGELDVSGNGTTSQYLRSDGDGSFTWAIPDGEDTWRGIDDTPVNDETEESISSNWAYDHVATHPAPTNRDTRNQVAGTYNTVIGTDTDKNCSGLSIIDQVNVTDGVITSMAYATWGTSEYLSLAYAEPLNYSHEERSGVTRLFPQADTATAYKVYYITGGSEAQEADADAASTAIVFGMALDSSSKAGEDIPFLISGVFKNEAWNWDPGGLIYLSTTAGEMTQTKPSGSGDQINVLGIAYDADTIEFNPRNILVEVD